MVKLAIANVSGMWASDWELLREGASYSWQTAEHWRREVLDEEDELFWIVGMDQWAALAKWSRVDYLSELVAFIVFPRDGETPEAVPGRNAVFLPDAMAVSATEIRTRARKGLSIEAQVEDDVAGFIREKGLYRDA
jgi:nicotinate-nucleotide adenylyltransferase